MTQLNPSVTKVNTAPVQQQQPVESTIQNKTACNQDTSTKSDLNDSNSDDPNCVTCEKRIIGNVWFVCTDPLCVQMDVWDYCSRECVAEHVHQDQIVKYTDCDNGNDLPFCSSCGCVFKPNSNIYQCKLCKSQAFEICTKCFTNNMHMKHKKHMEKITRKRLLSVQS